MGAFATSNPVGSGEVTGSGTANQVAVWTSPSSLGDPTMPFTQTATGFAIGSGSVMAAAALTINSTTQGFGPPRLTTAQRNAMVGVEAGIMIFNSTLDTLNFYTAGGGTPAWAGVITTATMPATFVVGDILYASSTSLLSRLADVDVGNVLVSGGVGVAPAWSSTVSIGTSLTVPAIIGVSGALTIGANAVATAITIGNVTGTTAVNINAGSSATTFSTTNATWTLNTGTGAINIGTDVAGKNITIGSSTAGTTIAFISGGDITFASNNGNYNFNSGTGAINIGTDAADHTITIGNSTGVQVTNIRSGTGALDIGTNAIAHTVTIGNTTGTSRTLINTGSAGSTWTTTNGSWAVLTGTAIFNISADSTVNAINIGTGAAAKTINIGSSSACLIGFFSLAVVRPTTAGAASTFVANTSGIANDTATLDNYKIGQLVKAFRNNGLLT